MNRAPAAAALLLLTLTLAPVSLSHAQTDPATRAAAIADREAAEERYKRLSTTLEDLLAARATDQQKLSALEEAIRNLRAEASRTDASKYAARDDLAKLAEAVREIDRKREADKKLILEQFDELKRDLRKILATPPPAGTPKKPAGTDAPGPKPKPAGSTTLPATQEGVEHTVASGETLSAIVTAYNETFKPQGRKTSLKLIQDANEGLKPTSLKVNQKIFIPLVPLQ